MHLNSSPLYHPLLRDTTAERDWIWSFHAPLYRSAARPMGPKQVKASPSIAEESGFFDVLSRVCAPGVPLGAFDRENSQFLVTSGHRWWSETQQVYDNKSVSRRGSDRT